MAIGWTAVSAVSGPVIGSCLARLGVVVEPRMGPAGKLDDVLTPAGASARPTDLRSR